MRRAAARALRQLGPLAAPARETLKRALEDADGTVRLDAAAALLGLP